LQMLSWAKKFNICSFLDDQQYKRSPHFYDSLLACGARERFSGSTVQELDVFLECNPDWRFFHLTFEALSDVVPPPSTTDKWGFVPIGCFVPEYVLILSDSSVQIGSYEGDHAQVYLAIMDEEPVVPGETAHALSIEAGISREHYLNTIHKLLDHIRRGDCYEINFCQEFYARDVVMDPLQTWLQLTTISPNPFSAFYRVGHSYLLCASPERFLACKGNRLISQPIKGTAPRARANPDRDNALKEQLRTSTKDRMENVMVVDLVRNDMSRVCREGTVVVSELYGVYAFPQVYQMISTIEGDVRPEIRFGDILQACFPMGSMTGAPKQRVLELIRAFEDGPRGLFSGSVGYMTPDGDFDANVVIRSLLYDQSSGYLSYFTGSGITAGSTPESEYEECLLKGRTMYQMLTGDASGFPVAGNS
jgi:para-aminobenzoate synthetase component I